MTVSSGFFNSVNHDRLYDAEQLSSIFDGIIVDGVYENVGEAFNVIAYPDEYNTVLVGTGRAWFNHTWTLNDSRFSITLDPPNEMLGRIDAIVIDVNKERDTRKNSIIYLKGDEANPDFPPALINTENHHQYPIAYITRHAEQNGPIDQSDIQITVGTGVCPIVTGILEAQNLENLMQQLDSEFNAWWDGIKDTLDENTVGKLQNQIDEINAKLDSDTALVGLLEKPIAEAFISGDYGLNVNTYTLSTGTVNSNPVKTAYELQNTATFLPNGETCYILAAADTNEGDYFLEVNLANTDGVNTPHKYSITDPYNADYDVNDKDAQAVLIESNVTGYPAKFVYLFTYFVNVRSEDNDTPVTLNYRLVTIEISSGGTVQLTTSETSKKVLSTYPSSGRDSIYFTPSHVTNTVKLSDGSQIYASLAYANMKIRPYMTSTLIALGVAFNITSDGAIGNVKETNLSSNYTTLTNSCVIHFMILHLVGDNVISYFARPDGGYNADSGCRLIINPETLDMTFVTDASAYPLPSRYNYMTSYGVQSYSLSEKNGVLSSEIKSGETPDVVSEKYSPYFLGASNLAESLPEGAFVAAKDPSGRLYGIASGGQQLAIGTNGGAAMLKTKISISSNIDISKVVTWLKGFYNSEDFTGYLMIDGTTNYVLSYTSYEHGASVGPGIAKTASVIKILKGV